MTVMELLDYFRELVYNGNVFPNSRVYVLKDRKFHGITGFNIEAHEIVLYIEDEFIRIT